MRLSGDGLAHRVYGRADDVKAGDTVTAWCGFTFEASSVGRSITGVERCPQCFMLRFAIAA